MRNKTPASVLLGGHVARAQRFFGLAGLIFWLAMAAFGAGEWFGSKPLETVDVVLPPLCLVFALLHILLWRRGRATAALLRSFRAYSSVFAIARKRRLSDLAATVNEPPQQVAAAVTEMCRRGWLQGYVDHQTQSIVFYAEEAHVVCCPGCGAKGVAGAPGAVCEYCGAPLGAPAAVGGN